MSRLPGSDPVFKVGDRVRYTLGGRLGGIPVQGTQGTVTKVAQTGTGTLYAIDWDGGATDTDPAWYATVLEPA